jgi:hypothetical protein
MVGSFSMVARRRSHMMAACFTRIQAMNTRTQTGKEKRPTRDIKYLMV